MGEEPEKRFIGICMAKKAGKPVAGETTEYAFALCAQLTITATGPKYLIQVEDLDPQLGAIPSNQLFYLEEGTRDTDYNQQFVFADGTVAATLAYETDYNGDPITHAPEHGSKIARPKTLGHVLTTEAVKRLGYLLPKPLLN